MQGLMQTHPLLVSSIITHAARHHAMTEVISKLPDGHIHRCTYADLEPRARRLADALRRLGVRPGDRVATLAWNSFRHFETYYAVSGAGAICHTVNPRLHLDDIAFIMADAADCVMLADATFIPLIEALAPRLTADLRAVILFCEPAEMPEVRLPAGMLLLCYEDLVAQAGADDAWPTFDENTASSLCYTSGTTGKPKGVLYSHRSTVLHAMCGLGVDTFAISALDRVMMVVPMFHANAWGVPYVAPMAGATLVLPGRHLDGESVQHLMNAERVTFSAGVPTVWLGLLQHLRATGTRLDTVKRVACGGAAVPSAVIEAFRTEYGVRVEHAWGMTETSPIGTYNTPKQVHRSLSEDEAAGLRAKQGRVPYGIDVKIVGGSGEELPWDGVAFGDLLARGPWVAGGYFKQAPGSALGTDGWFATGDVASIDADGVMEITDRSKDVIKSGGEWISSIALENIAMAHPDVAEAAVIAARHEKWTERPLLLVVAKSGRSIDKASLLASYEGLVAKWWLPDEVLVIADLPHTATGKLQKSALRAQYRDYLVSGGPVAVQS